MVALVQYVDETTFYSFCVGTIVGQRKIVTAGLY